MSIHGFRNVVLATILIVPAAWPANASSTNGRVGPQLVSQADPLPAHGTPGACGSEPAYQGWDHEPTLAVTASGRFITAWTQDWADAISVAFSDKGRTWTEVVPMTSGCTGGLAGFNSAYDPWLAVGPPSSNPSLNQVVYLSSALRAFDGITPPQYATVVNRSLDGGRTWSAPVEVADRPLAVEYLDGSTVTADPSVAGVAYATWRRGDLSFAGRSQYVAKTTDGGVTWSDPVKLPAIQLPAAGNLVVLSDGSVVAITVEVPPQPQFATGSLTGPSTITVTRSTDGGATWSQPSVMAEADPNMMVGVRAAVGPDDAVHATWQRAGVNAEEPSFDLMLSSSHDGGMTWSAPRAAGPTIAGPPSFSAHGVVAAAPSLAVSPHGTLGIRFYDHRRDDTRSSPPTTTDYWFRSSSDGGATWQEQHVAGPFDQTSAPSDDGSLDGPGFLGDNQGIAAVKGGIAVTYTLAAPLAATAPTDIFISQFPDPR